MDRALNALINLDVPENLVRIDIRGSLNHESRPDLVHIIRRVRSMGVRSHIRVDLSQAVLVESSALAGLRSDLVAMDLTSMRGLEGAGVSLHISPPLGTWASDAAAGTAHTATGDGGFGFPEAGDGLPLLPVSRLEDLLGRPLTDYSDEELLAASDMLFALLDHPKAFAGPDLLGRYNDIGREIGRRQENREKAFPAEEGQAAG